MSQQKKAYFILVTILMMTASCSFSSKTTHKLYAKAEGNSYDIVVVPGVPFEDGKWSDLMMWRVYWSKFLYDKGIARNVMYSGSAVYSPYDESKIMSLYAEALGIPKENIFTESKAEHSTENIFYSFKKSKKLGFESVALASDPFQTKMLRGFTKRRLGKEVKLIPIVWDSLNTMTLTTPEIDYRQAYVEDFIPLTEREGFWKRLRGTMGKRIDKKAYELP